MFCRCHTLKAVNINTNLVQVVGTIGMTAVDGDDNSLDFVPTSPLGITRMAFYSSNILADFGLNTLQQEVVNRIKGIGEDKFTPGEYPELIAS